MWFEEIDMFNIITRHGVLSLLMIEGQIKESVQNYQRHLPRKLRKALLTYKKLGKELAKTTDKGQNTQRLDSKYRKVQANFKKMMTKEAPSPARNKEGVLKPSLWDILNVQKEHYQSMMQHDPDNLAMHKATGQRKTWPLTGVMVWRA